MFWFMMLKTRKDLWLEECRKRAVSFPISCFWKPVGDVIFVPLLPRESVAFLPGSVLRLLRFYVGEAAARLPHCSARPNTKTQICEGFVGGRLISVDRAVLCPIRESRLHQSCRYKTTDTHHKKHLNVLFAVFSKHYAVQHVKQVHHMQRLESKVSSSSFPTAFDRTLQNSLLTKDDALTFI